jgi:hypothetical protein
VRLSRNENRLLAEAGREGEKPGFGPYVLNGERT